MQYAREDIDYHEYERERVGRLTIKYPNMPLQYFLLYIAIGVLLFKQ